MRTRNITEWCFGILKSRFMCLDKSGGTLLYSVEKAQHLHHQVDIHQENLVDPQDQEVHVQNVENVWMWA